MRIAAPTRLLVAAVSAVVVLAGPGCKKSESPSSESAAAPTSSTAPPAQADANVTVRAADAFYDPPADVPSRPGSLLRSEPLKDVTLPPGSRGWRILYTT